MSKERMVLHEKAISTSDYEQSRINNMNSKIEGLQEIICEIATKGDIAKSCLNAYKKGCCVVCYISAIHPDELIETGEPFW